MSFCTKLWSYFSLLKPRVTFLVLFTALCGVVLSSYSTESFSAFSVLVALLCIYCGSGGAGAINMWYDRDIDSIMSRTKTRPIPSGAVSSTEAIVFALTLCFFSVALIFVFVNPTSAALLAVAIFYYAVIYTMWLKRKTVQNIVIGGAAGAFPPVIGWSAVTGEISIDSITLFCIIFFWTPPHFWALALKNSSEYKSAGVPMLPVVHGNQKTKEQILIYSVILFGICLLSCFTLNLGFFYIISSLALNTIFLLQAIWLYKDESRCMDMFRFSVIYLFLLFGCMVFDRLFFAPLNLF